MEKQKEKENEQGLKIQSAVERNAANDVKRENGAFETIPREKARRENGGICERNEDKVVVNGSGGEFSCGSWRFDPNFSGKSEEFSSGKSAFVRNVDMERNAAAERSTNVERTFRMSKTLSVWKTRENFSDIFRSAKKYCGAFRSGRFCLRIYFSAETAYLRSWRR